MENKIKVIQSKVLSKRDDQRFIIIDIETGQILDDAQGYGYKSKKKAYAAYYYKNRDKSKDIEKQKKTEIIKQWCKENKKFMGMLNAIDYDIMLGRCDPNEKINTKLIKKLLKENECKDIPFSAQELCKVYVKGKL